MTTRLTFPHNGVMRYEVVDFGGSRRLRLPSPRRRRPPNTEKFDSFDQAKVICWMAPFVNTSSNSENIQGQNLGKASNYDQAASQGFFVRASAGGPPLVVPWWKGKGRLRARRLRKTRRSHSQRSTSSHSNARLEGLNGFFQAARARARGYRNTTTFATMAYVIAAPLGDFFQPT